MHKIKEKLMKQLMDYDNQGDITLNTLEIIHKITDTIKNIDKIEMLEDEDFGYSERGYSRRYSRDNYDGGSSYANRGQHYVRGHYSRDDSGYSNDYERRYSREDGKDFMMKKIDEMLGEAKTPAEREALKECIKAIERAN